MFCAGHGRGGNDTCKGDSGGSTVREVLRDGKRRWVTVGLVSWGEKCGIKGKYGYYTRLEPFVDWIHQKVNGSILSCGHPGNIRNGRIIGSHFLVGFSVRYTCDEGYRLRGRSTSRCKRNGTWTKIPSCKKVECRDPGTPRNGVRRPRRKKFHYKEKIRFRCKTNYTLLGRSAIMCRYDGTWSGFKPACLAPCKDPGIPQGGARLDHSFKHGQTVRFMCRKKNQPPSLSYLNCNNGRWSQNIPRCIADCDDPGIPVHGQRQGNDFTLRKRVYFTCDRGYMRLGPEYLECQSNRRWSDKAPTCEPLSCTRPTPPENAHIFSTRQLKEKYGFNEVVKFQCNRGYRGHGSPFVKCLPNGWSNTNLRCPPKNCGDPGTPANGRRQGNVFTFNSKVNFTCAVGYEVKGSVQRVCQENDTWSGTRTTCDPRNCGDPGTPANGRRQGDVFTFNNEVNFTCAVGYEVKGSAQRVCQENGMWSGTRTTCERVECKDLAGPRNGIRKPDKNKYLFEDRVDFSCSANHTLKGNVFIICQSDSTWTASVPRCLAPCRDPGIPVGGRRNQHSFLHNKVVQFQCKRGWSMKGSRTIRCTNGRWDHDPPTCNIRCGRRTNKKPYRYCLDRQCTKDRNCGANERCLCDGDCGLSCVRNGTDCRNPESFKGLRTRLSDGTKFGSIATFRCRGDQYTLRGSRKRVCRGIGKWDGKPAKCRILCKHPGDIAFGNNNGDKKFYRVGSTINYWCFPGYDMEGKATISCTNKGKWNTSPPKCSAPSCAKPTPADNAYIFSRRKLKDKYQFNEVVMFRCEDGYYGSGSSFRRCLASGWSNSNFRCIPKSCGDPGSPVNGRREGYVLTFKKKVSFKCNRGYVLVGPEYRQCQSNQTWSDRTPTCEPIDCGRLPPPRYGEKIEETSTSYLGQVVFECKKTGYELKGSAKRICQENGRWSGNKTTCEPYCRDPGVPTNGHRHDHSFSDSAIVRFSCRNGWNIEGSHTIRCNNGNWDHPTPRCLECGSALGMESGKIPDGNIQASSTRYRYHAKDGRLNGRYAWCSGMERGPYLQIDLGIPYRITGLATQGSAYDNRWVEKYTLQSNLAGSSYSIYRENRTDRIFKGNTDSRTTVRHKLKSHLISRRIRISPVKHGGFYASPACMRLEVYGCELPSDCILIGSRIVAKWSSNVRGGYRYYKAYLTGISGRFWKVELENDNHGRPRYKDIGIFEDLPFVLDVPPKHEELQVGTRVIAPWGYTYYTSTINTGKDRLNRYRVRTDYGDEKDFTIDQIRLLKEPTYCN